MIDAPATRIRPARADDEAAIETVAIANDESILWPGLPGSPYLAHMLAAGDMRVAELGGTVVGFAGAIRVESAEGRPATHHLTDLFVHPGAQSKGVGRALLAALQEGRGSQWATFSSNDPRAISLYSRVGMRPTWPAFYLDGPSGVTPAASGAAPGAVVRRIEAAEAAELELTMTSQRRAATYRYWLGLPSSYAFAVELEGAAAAVGVVRGRRAGDGRWLERLVVHPDADGSVALATAIADPLVGGPPGGRLGLVVPGPQPLFPTLLERGFRIFDRDTFCATEPDLVDPTRIIPDSSFG